MHQLLSGTNYAEADGMAHFAVFRAGDLKLSAPLYPADSPCCFSSSKPSCDAHPWHIACSVTKQCCAGAVSAPT